MVRRTRTVVVAGCLATIVGGLLLLAAAPAGASLTGKCTASGTLVTGKPSKVYATYDPKVVDKATIPRKGNVEWIGGTGVTDRRDANGEVRIKMPIGEITIGEWGKDGEKVSKQSNSGTYKYDLPSVFAGIKVPVTGEHHEPGIDCKGAVLLTVKGRSPLAWVSVALTAIAVMNMSFVMRARRRVRP